MPEHLTVYIRPDGTMQFIYSDALSPLMQQALEKRILRVSHAEPDDEGNWRADLSPIGGPVSPPFALRQDALNWEIAWLEQHLETHTITAGGL